MKQSRSPSRFRIAAVLLLALACVLLKGGQGLYAWSGDTDSGQAWTWTAALFDWDGWWAFTRSPVGLASRVGGLAALAAALVCSRCGARGGAQDESA